MTLQLSFANSRLAAAVTFVLLLDLSSCSSKPAELPPPQDATARVSIAPGDGDFNVSLAHGAEVLETWRTDTIDAALGGVVAEKLSTSPRTPRASGIIVCGDREIPVDRLSLIAGGLPSEYDVVICTPDRKNCRNSCPDS